MLQNPAKGATPAKARLPMRNVQNVMGNVRRSPENERMSTVVSTGAQSGPWKSGLSSSPHTPRRPETDPSSVVRNRARTEVSPEGDNSNTPPPTTPLFMDGNFFVMGGMKEHTGTTGSEIGPNLHIELSVAAPIVATGLQRSGSGDLVIDFTGTANTTFEVRKALG